MIAGELQADPAMLTLARGGAVDVHDNPIQANMGNDDGGGLRFLMAGKLPVQRLQQRRRQQYFDP